MSSISDTYKVLIAGDEEYGFAICTRLIDRELTNPRTLAVEALSKDWPHDEWIKFITLSSVGFMTTIELDLELHGPWVWELYNVMEPRDYFRRFDGAVIVANPRKPDAMSYIPPLVESIDTHLGHRIPMMMMVDTSPGLSSDEIACVEELANQLDILFAPTDISAESNLDEVFKELAFRINEATKKI
ncbi:MAG: hypothetical protein P1Q69_18145 [Candidatus Thorarchaeota archaeon]|nr:hypothetical protein [Candidatus Thorarchaeota archaeon]